MRARLIATVQEESFLGDGAAEEVLPRVLPPSWRLLDRVGDGASYRHVDGLLVFASVARELDERRWLHVSLSRRARLPSYDDMKAVKSLFVGRDRKAVQVFPAEAEHVNIHPFTLHLFACLDGDPLPDFTQGTGSL